MTVVPGWRGKFLTAALAMLPRRLRIRVLARILGHAKPTGASGGVRNGADAASFCEEDHRPSTIRSSSVGER